MTASIRAEIEKAFPCDNVESYCSGSRHSGGCIARKVPAVLAIVERAIAEERERCAKIGDLMGTPANGDSPIYRMARKVADAIRAGGTP